MASAGEAWRGAAPQQVCPARGVRGGSCAPQPLGHTLSQGVGGTATLKGGGGRRGGSAPSAAWSPGSWAFNGRPQPLSHPPSHSHTPARPPIPVCMPAHTHMRAWGYGQYPAASRSFAHQAPRRTPLVPPFYPVPAICARAVRMPGAPCLVSPPPQTARPHSHARTQLLGAQARCRCRPGHTRAQTLEASLPPPLHSHAIVFSLPLPVLSPPPAPPPRRRR